MSVYFLKKRSYAREKTAGRFRTFIFGVEDSLVSTVGLLSGIAIAETPLKIIILTGVILVLVEAFSMAVGSFLSEYSAEEYSERRRVSPKESLIDGAIMFFSYLLSGLIPLAPYIFFSQAMALPISIVASVSALFLLGILSAKISRISMLYSGMRVGIIGGVAILIGILAGSFIR